MCVTKYVKMPIFKQQEVQNSKSRIFTATYRKNNLFLKLKHILSTCETVITSEISDNIFKKYQTVLLWQSPSKYVIKVFFFQKKLSFLLVCNALYIVSPASRCITKQKSSMCIAAAVL